MSLSPLNPFNARSAGPATETRLTELDGVRGWAALSVMLFHIYWEVFGVAEPTFRNMLSAALLNGQLDVAVFFVLSGEALSASYWRDGNHRSVIRLAVKRYFRLTVPILFSCLSVYILIKLGLTKNIEAGSIVGRQDWLGVFVNFKENFLNVIKYSFIDVYFKHRTEASYNPFLWTMSIELLGSAVVFLYIFCDERIRKKTLAITALGLLFLLADSFVACFMIGLALGRARSQGLFQVLQSNKVINAAAPLLCAAVLLFCAWLQIHQYNGAKYYAVPSGLLLFFLSCSGWATRALRSSFSRWLGKISFSLYLVHFPVIVSFTSGAIILAHRHGMLGTSTIWLIAGASAALSLAVAVLFLPVERLTARVGDGVLRFVGESDKASESLRSGATTRN